jgi:hypothetical protein
MPYWLFITILSVFCVFLFSFSFWKGLKDDYISSQIFSVSITVIFTFTGAVIISNYFKEYRFWILFFALILGYIIGSYKNAIKIYDGYDSFVVSVLISGLLSSVILFYSASLPEIIFYISLAASLLVYFLVHKQYKSFIWYRSGKRGFSGLFITGLFFLIRSAVSLVKPELTIMVTTYDIFISGLISFVSFLNIFILGR